MEFILGNLAVTFVGLVFILLCIICLYLTRDYDYWVKKGIPNKTPIFPFGSTKDLVLAKTYIGKGYDKMYKEFIGERFFGIIEVHNPVLVVRDPELIKAILVRDFNHFSVRTPLGKNPKEFILRHVINMSGQEWKHMRTILAPAFTSLKMKHTFSLMKNCSDKLIKNLIRIGYENPDVEVTDVFARFTMDVIATSAFGFETDCVNNPSCTFFSTVGPMLKTTKARFFRRFLISFFPSLAKILPVQQIPPKVTNLLTRTVYESVYFREKNCLKRNDFLDVLIKARESLYSRSSDVCPASRYQHTGRGLTIEQMTAQAFVFFIAGYTTDTNILTFCLYELCKHQDVQEKLHQEIRYSTEKHGGHICYEAIQDMRLLDQIINEALRLYGSGQTLTRTCTIPYQIPGSDVVLEKGIRVIIPTYSLHHDPNYYPQPYEFIPDRFTPEEISKRHPFVFLPFGEGPRNCIGRSFGILHIKIGLASVISNFQVKLSAKQEVPVKIDKRCIVVTPANPVFIQFQQRLNT